MRNSKSNKQRQQYINVPNLFTTINLFCGFLSVAMTMSGKYAAAGWVIFMAGIFDALDGRIARASGQSSEFGLEMDSLADVISSGIAPAVLVYEYYLKNVGSHPALGLMLGFLPLLFSTFRLARYNVMTRCEGHRPDFMGMPAPMAATTLASIVILHIHTNWTFLLRGILILTPLVALAMASHFRYDGMPRFSIKQKGGNRFKLLAFFVALVFMFFVPEFTLFIFMMVYLVSGPARFVHDLVTAHGATDAILDSDENLAADHSAR